MSACPPEDGRAADVFRFQCHTLEKLIAQAVVESAVEAWRAPMRLENPEALDLVLTVHEQLRLVPVDAHQDHVLHGAADVTADQLVCNAVREGLRKEEEKKRRLGLSTWLTIPAIRRKTFVSSISITWS